MKTNATKLIVTSCVVLSTVLGLNLFTAPNLGVVHRQAQNLFVANQLTNTVREFSPSGVDLGDFATTGLSGPTGLAFDRGNLYVSNLNSNTIRKFSSTGVDLGNFANAG